MARPGLTRHRKFARLARLLGSEVLARGHLEFVWDVAYENGDDLLGDAGDLEHLAKWNGPAGELAAAMVQAGFVDESPEGLRVHDLWHHAPQYVTKRAAREAERTEKGETLSSIRAKAGRKGAERRWQTDGTRIPLATESMANGLPPAPAPTQKELLSAPAPQETRKATDPRFGPLRVAWEAEFRAATGADYRWGGPADAKGIHRVIAVSVDEFTARAHRALRAAGYLRCGTVAKLTSGEVWNQLAAVNQPNGVAGKPRAVLGVSTHDTSGEF